MTESLRDDSSHPPVMEIVNATSTTPLLIICDHASNTVPSDLHDLGLTRELLAQHIGWDIGAAAVARRLAHALNATAVLSRFSRLVIDPNRDPRDPTSIPSVSDGIAVPGNHDLSIVERTRRQSTYFHPYHHAINDEIARLSKLVPPALLSVHSFTPEMGGVPRPWHIGVLWNRDPRMAVSLLRQLRAHADDFVVGDNQPYSGQLVAYTLHRHGGDTGLPHVAVEIRQDLVADDAQAARWAAVLEPCLREILAEPELHRVRHY